MWQYIDITNVMLLSLYRQLYYDNQYNDCITHYYTLHKQVKDTSGGSGYITVPHIDGALQVNIGGVMQRWTADKYVAPVSQISY